MYKAHRFTSAVVTEALNINPQELPILGKSLKEVQDWAVRLSAGQWSDNDEAQLWIRDDVYVTHQAIYAFLEEAKAQEKVVSWRAEGLVGGFVEEIALEDPTPMMIWSPTMSIWNDTWLQEAETVEVEVTAHTISMPAPQADMEYDVIQLPITDAVVMPMRPLVSDAVGQFVGFGALFMARTGGTLTGTDDFETGMGLHQRVE